MKKIALYILIAILCAILFRILSWNIKPTYYEAFDSNDIKIIYFAAINKERNWKDIIEGQLVDLKQSGLSDVAEIYLIVTNIGENDSEIKNEITELAKKYSNRHHIEFHSDNIYEYRGIKKLYDIGVSNPESILLYMHSKGMFYNNQSNKRNGENIKLTKSHINRWKEVVNIFNEHPEYGKICGFPSKDGWCWFNFFWTTGKYISTCEDPKQSMDNRYYYESWLSSSKDPYFKSYCLGNGESTKTFEPTDAVQTLIELQI